MQSSLRLFVSASEVPLLKKQALQAKVLASTLLNAAGLALTGPFFAQNLCAKLKSNEW